MTTFSTITESHGTSQDFPSYEDRLMCYFDANDITVEKKTSTIFVSVVGDDIYTLLMGLVAPKSPGDIKLDDILRHCTPDTNTMVERYRFYNWTRSSGQSIKSCIAELKDLARLCLFGKTEEGTELTPQLILEESLRDRLVCGISDKKIQRRLLSERKLTFSTAVEIATAMETAESGASQLTSRASVPVNWISKKKTEKENRLVQLKPCYRCLGDSRHSTCPFRDNECLKCHNKGHTRAACKCTSYQQPSTN